ncbi:MAG TPA: hypothetical protein DDX37_01840 [Candidatus Omnitrophica bacterium]|nr:hypothetical protein [Candidatus Omnitrophota bacterium]
MEEKFYTIVEEIYEKDSRYKEEAYAFVMEALGYTQKKFKNPKHVSGDQLLDGIKELLMNKFGPMTMTVLEYWGIQKTEDFGNIVFNLVKNKVLTKTEDDDIEHFKDAYDFDEVFNRGYRKLLNKKISRMRQV